MIFNILSFIAILQGAIQISDLSYIFYQSNKIQLTLHDFETLKLILSFPWQEAIIFQRIIKPIWGFCSDIFPIAKYKRKPYLFIFAIICFLLETFMAVSDVDRKTAFVIIFLIQLCIVFCNVIAEAVLVEQSHEVNTSRNVALFFGMRAVGGYLYTYIAFNFPIHRNNFQVLSLFPLLIAILSVFLPEQQMVDEIKMKQLRANLQKFILDPVIYRPLLFIFFFMATPSPATSMFYFYINQLKLNDEFFITLRYTYSFCTIMAVTVYYLFRRYPFGQFLSVSNMLYFFASFLSLLLVTRINIEYNIPDYQFCMWDNILMQTLQEINTLPVLVLGAKMCPKNLEGTVYSLLTGTMNLGNTISKQIGIVLTFYLGITNQNFTHLWLLILICTVGSLLPMPFIGAVNEEEVDQKKKSLAKDDIHIKVE